MASGIEAVGQFREPIDHDVSSRIRYGIRRAGGSPFIGSAHEGGAIADISGRVEIEIVTRHHQDFVRFDSEKPGRAPIGVG